MSNQDIIIIYSRDTKNVCICTIVSIFLILLFIISPLNKFILASMFGKIIILSILAYALYKNINVTFQFSKNVGFFSGSWNNTKTNILCSHVFSIFIFILILSVLRRMF
jgi:hypothetical protein